jgi:hypothetical protein
MKKLVYLEDLSLTGIPISKLMIKALREIPDDKKNEILSIYQKLHEQTLLDLQKAYEMGISEGRKQSLNPE